VIRSTLAIIPCLFLVALPCCAPSRQSLDAAFAAERPPQDFVLSVTVMRPLADTTARAAAYKQQPIATRPARYVLEADHILRVSIGSAVSEETFPPETRQLTREQVDAVWNTLRTSRLAAAEEKTLSGAPPRPENLSDKQTLYIISYAAAGDRRSFLITPPATEPAADPTTADARKLVEQLGQLAWMGE